MRLLSEAAPPQAEGYSASYRCHYAPDGDVLIPGDPQSLYESFLETSKRCPERPSLGWRPVKDGEAQPYTFMTYAELASDTKSIGSALKAMGVQPGASVGVYAANSPQWMTAMKAVDFCGGICVPLYDTFGPDAIKYIIKHSEATVIFVASDNLATLASCLPEVQDQVSQVVVWSSAQGVPLDEEAVKAAAGKASVPITPWSDFLALGNSKPAEATPGTLDSLCTVMYTSGTTGNPKGVEITHRAILSCSGALLMLLEQYKVEVGEEDVFLSYLPLAHIFDRVAEETFLVIGGSIGYWRGSAKGLMDDVGALKPTVFVGVPRIFDRLYTGVTEKVAASGRVPRMMFGAGMALKGYCLNFGACTLPVLDQLVFNKIKNRLGGRVKVMVSGGAPLAKHVEHFLKTTMCCPVAQGYGLTETCGASFIADPFDPGQATTVGAPVAGLEVCLRSIPDMGYDARADTPQGEVLLRGPAVFSAYHKQPNETSEAKDKDGWFHTGDVGELRSCGSLKIIDRIKNFFKLAHGEYVAAEKLENVYKKVTLVDQIWVYGDSERAQLVAIVVPNETMVSAFATENNLPVNFNEFCESSGAATELQKVLEAEGRSAGLKGFEIVKKLHLTSEAFSVDNDLMTPSFKLKRPQLKKRYGDVIQAMYSTLP